MLKLTAARMTIAGGYRRAQNGSALDGPVTGRGAWGNCHTAVGATA
jgi:hypothetical protein